MELEVMDFTPLKLPTLSSMGVVTRSSTDSESAPGYTVYTIFIGISISGISSRRRVVSDENPNTTRASTASRVVTGRFNTNLVNLFITRQPPHPQMSHRLPVPVTLLFPQMCLLYCLPHLLR